MEYSETYETLRSHFDDVFVDTADYQDATPKQGDKKVSSYVNALWNDSIKYFSYEFIKSKSESRFGYSDPESFWDALDKLENGQHWEVFGSRKSGDNNSWKQEFVDNEIQDQLRARNAFITANWHDITVTPNIKGISDILDQERKATKWGSNVKEYTKYAQKYGFVWIRSILDKTKNPLGEATEITCRPGSVLLSPKAKSKDASDGCWYAIHGQEVTGQWITKNYPDFELSDFSSINNTPKFLQIDRNQKENSYSHTKVYNKLEVFLDDATLETIPFNQEIFDKRIGGLMANIQSGEQNEINPLPEDNHKKFIKAYIIWLEERVNHYKKIVEQTHANGGTLLPEDTDLMNKVVSHVSEQIFKHEDILEKQKESNPEIPVGKRKKYPFGRNIVTINGVTVEDTKSIYEFDWRKLFHYLPNENVPERIDGRSDIEILWQDVEVLDTMLSRFADDALLATNKKPWFPQSEKSNIEKNGYSTDPTEIGYYATTKPEFATGSPNGQYLESWKIAKGNIKQKLAINETTYGKGSSARESGKHAELLLSQNAVLVTGELNQNLNDVIEDIVETRIEMWKQFYVEPRIFNIEGTQQSLILAEYLRQQEVEENGQIVIKDIPDLQITIRPNSNFPNKVESDVQTLIQLRNAFPDDVPAELIFDQLAQRFPALSRNGKYRKENEFTKIGKQVVAQQNAQKEERAKQQKKEANKPTALDDVKRKVQNQITTSAANQITQGQQNGQEQIQ